MSELSSFGEKLRKAIVSQPKLKGNIQRRLTWQINKASFADALELHKTAQQLNKKLEEK